MTTKAEKQLAEQRLRELVAPGDTVYTTLRHVSRSGMYRALDVYVIRDNQPLRITYDVATLTGNRYDRNHEALGIGGVGMDMGFAVVYDLSWALFGKGWRCIGERKRCPAAEHSNDQTPRDGRRKHSDGYALHHRWLG